ncbi:MAG TPA: ABC transporter permease [Terriglobales bacterium]|jgi:putative ABC transport system permease protein
MDSFLFDVRYGLRMLAKKPTFTAIAALTLALGIGANTAIFSAVNAVLLRPLEFSQAGQLTTIWENDKANGQSNVGYATFLDFQQRNRSFQAMAVSGQWQPILSGDSAAERLAGRRVSRDFFNVLRVRPFLGRDFLPEEDRQNANRSVILTYGLWKRRFGGDRAIVGKNIDLSGRSYLVVGVLPDNFAPVFDNEGEQVSIWAPLGYDVTLPQACRDCRHLRAIGRLRPGVSLDQAWADLTAISSDLFHAYPTSYSQAGVILVPLKEDLVGKVRTPLYVLLAAVLLVLLIACANVAGLLLSRATERAREMAVRTALGASRWRLLRQLLVEGLLLCLLGGATGILFGYWSVQWIRSIAGNQVPLVDTISLDARVFAFALVLSLLSGLIFGLAPGLHFGKADLGERLADGGRSSTGAKRQRLRSALVIGNVAVALVLLLGVGLLVRSLQQLLEVHTGFDAHNVLTANVDVAGPNYRKDEQFIAFYQQVLERVRALPGVETAGFTSQLPLGGNVDGYGVHVEGKVSPNPQNDPSADRYSITPDYLRAMRIPVLQGRGFNDEDRSDSLPVVLVNQSLARHMWPNEDPLGARVKVGGMDGPWRMVVGVVGDVLHAALDAAHTDQIYMPETQFTDSGVVLVVRGTIAPANLASPVRGAIAAIDRNQAVSKVATMDEVVHDSLGRRSFVLSLLAVFASLALILASVGLYGVVSQLVSQRGHEIGIRMALGAEPGVVKQMVLRQGLSLALAGLIVGIPMGLGTARALSTLLFRVSPADPFSFLTVMLLLLIIAATASYVPARRAANTNPMVVLRHE